MCVCPLAAKDALLCRLLKRDSCLICQASRSTGLRTVAIWSSPNALESVAFMCMCVCRCDCVFLCQRKIEIERNSGGREKERGEGGCGGWKQLRNCLNCLSLSVHISSLHLSLSLSFSRCMFPSWPLSCPLSLSLCLSAASTVGPTLAWLGAMRA